MPFYNIYDIISYVIEQSLKNNFAIVKMHLFSIPNSESIKVHKIVNKEKHLYIFKLLLKELSNVNYNFDISIKFRNELTISKKLVNSDVYIIFNAYIENENGNVQDEQLNVFVKNNNDVFINEQESSTKDCFDTVYKFCKIIL